MEKFQLPPEYDTAQLQELVRIFPQFWRESYFDFDEFKAYISGIVPDDLQEKYSFTWHGKAESYRLLKKNSNGTLRPCKEDSVNWDSTQNLYIEGDNLEVLKLIKHTYAGEKGVKMIYIDPPYNTSEDFIYDDNFMDSLDKYLEYTGQKGIAIPESSGRYHTRWLNMMYPRLWLANYLLRDDGVIFISIDDREVTNLRRMCDEIFGEENFVAQLVWERAYSPKNDAKYISNSHDYVLMYAKSIADFQIGRLPRTEEANARYTNPDNDPRGVWKPSDMSVKTYNPETDYPITAPSGRVIEPPAGRCWSLSKNSFFERLQDNRIWFGADGNSVPQIKRFLTELKFEGMAPQSMLFYKSVGHSQEGAKEVTALLEAGVFDGPKPVRLLRHFLTLANTDEHSVILDFFSGSATTAHAVMQLNAEDGGNRKFIMVQLPEVIAEKSEAHKAGYRNICEIGKERIRRAGAEISKNHPNVDIGFRVFKLDKSNFKIWDDTPVDPKNPDEVARLMGQLSIHADSPFIDGRSHEDIVYDLTVQTSNYGKSSATTER